MAARVRGNPGTGEPGTEKESAWPGPSCTALSRRSVPMADYFSPTVIQPAIPVADITPLERLLLSHIFNVEAGDDGLYFYEDEGPAHTIWLDRAAIDAALAQSPATAESAAASFVMEQLARVPTMSRSN